MMVLLGNMFSLVAVVFNYINGTRKKKRDMILCDAGASLFYAIADFLLKGYSGAVMNLVGLFRNICALFFEESKAFAWVLIGCSVVLGIYFNNLGIIGVLPVFTGFYYSICIINTETGPTQMKLAFILNTLAFLIYSVVIQNYIGVISNAIIIVSAARSYFEMKKD